MFASEFNNGDAGLVPLDADFKAMPEASVPRAAIYAAVAEQDLGQCHDHSPG